MGIVRGFKQKYVNGAGKPQPSDISWKRLDENL